MTLRPNRANESPSYPSTEEFRRSGLAHLAIAAAMALGPLVLLGCERRTSGVPARTRGIAPPPKRVAPAPPESGNDKRKQETDRPQE